MSTPLITDSQSISGATGRFGHKIPVYDDSWGPLWIHCDSMGISGIVRAKTWEDAYSICEDEFFPEADETIEELRKEYNFNREHVKIIKTLEGVEREAVDSDYPRTVRGGHDGRASWEFVRWETRETPCESEFGFTENELFQESFGFRPNGPSHRSCVGPQAGDKHNHGIYAKDLNGDRLELLTAEMVKEMEITLQIVDNEE